MKLKKIASLMLAGVMAVSMLAGCSGKGGSNNNNNNQNEDTNTSSMVVAVNEAQEKIEFTADATMTNVLSKMASIYGSSNVPAEKDIKEFIQKSTGAADYDSDFYNAKSNAEKIDDGAERTVLYVKTVKSSEAYNEDAAMNIVARNVADEVEKLADTTFVDVDDDKKNATEQGEKYADYTYAGEISDMVTIEDVTGTSTYVVVYTITQTCAVTTF